MNRFNKLINKINEWRDIVMTEDRKRDLQNFIAAGKKVVAKLKKYHDDKIVSYDGEDAFYSDADEYADDIDNAIENAYEGNVAEEQPSGYYEKIMNKLDTVKDSIKGNEGISEILKKAENLFKSDVLTKEQLQTELDELMVELEDKLSALSEKSVQIAGSIDNLTEQSKSNYSNITASITEVSDKTDDMISTLAEVSAVLKSSAPKLDEIREASIGIDKLTDSLFELKNANIKVKNDIEAINSKIKFLKIWGISACSVIAVIAAVILALEIF